MAGTRQAANRNERDRQGRYRRGVSGNPKGRGPGRPPEAVNSLADEGVVAVLEHDLAVVRDEKATARQRRESLDRLARLGARRITAEEHVTGAGAASSVVVYLPASRGGGRSEAEE